MCIEIFINPPRTRDSYQLHGHLHFTLGRFGQFADSLGLFNLIEQSSLHEDGHHICQGQSGEARIPSSQYGARFRKPIYLGRLEFRTAALVLLLHARQLVLQTHGGFGNLIVALGVLHHDGGSAVQLLTNALEIDLCTALFAFGYV